MYFFLTCLLLASIVSHSLMVLLLLKIQSIYHDSVIRRKTANHPVAKRALTCLDLLKVVGKKSKNIPQVVV